MVAYGVDDESEAPAERPHRLARLTRGQIIAIVAALVLLLALLGLWLERKQIAGGVIDRTLAAKNVPARYDIADLGLGRQRLTDIVLGDPANPDLVADWIETRTTIGLGGASVTGVRAGHVRMRGRIVDGKLSLGALDRLMPPSSGKPFSLPKLDIVVDDARMRFETPIGVVGLKAMGSGRLDDGFDGRIAAVSNRLTPAGCVLRGLSAAMRIVITQGSPHLVGPARAEAARCGTVTARAIATNLDATLSPALDRWRGSVKLATGMVATPDYASAHLGGDVGFAGNATGTGGTVDLAARDVRGATVDARRVSIDGRYEIGREQAFEGQIGVDHASLARDIVARVAGFGAGEGTPIAPLANRLRAAIVAAGRDVSGRGRVILRRNGARGAVRADDVSLRSASGAKMSVSGAKGIAYGWPGGDIGIDADVAMHGGGLPEARITLRQAGPGMALTGRAVIEPYAAGDARLALTPVEFRAAADGVTRVSTRATVSGPIGNGRIDGLTVPIDARWNGRGGLVVGSACVPVSFDRLLVSGLTLDPARLALCPTDSAIVRVMGGKLDGGARIAATRLTGRLGATPVTLAMGGAEVSLGRRGFSLTNVATRIGGADRMTRLDFARVDGRLAGGDVAGNFSGGKGQIANVPLLLSDAAGSWILRGGALRVAGALGVSDAEMETPRFKPMQARDVTLSLIDSQIAARGTLYEPTKDVQVATVDIRHDLRRGAGDADLNVAGITFGKEFQPDLLTPVTFGVIADVTGTVTGAGHIAWNGDGVTSTGDFATDGTDLAAAFGPVTGIKGKIHFTDLLALESAPGQVASVATINPGIPVTDGRIVYQTYRQTKVLVSSGTWPFAGGTLTLDPTLLDFAAERARHMTFRIKGMEADKFLQQFDFKNLDATGVFDGVMPMVFDANGGNIVDGRLTVREGGGTIRYVGDISQKDLGFWANIAFGALKSLRYRSLDIVMNGPLAGEMVTGVRFEGISQGEGATSNFIIRRLQKLPFVFNIRIKAPFRGLLDSAQSFYDPKRLIERNLPALLEQQRQQTNPVQTPHVQPTDSETMP